MPAVGERNVRHGARSYKRCDVPKYCLLRSGCGLGALRPTMTQQAAMLAFMDCFHLLGLVVLAGLPLAFFIRRF